MAALTGFPVEYAALKAVHVTSAILSITGFAARGLLMLRDSPLLRARFVRIAPHVLDTVLLGSAIALAWLSGQYPIAQSWLTAKVLALVAYVVLGSIALSRGRTKRIRRQAFGLALLATLYIVSVAVLRDPAGPVALFR
jgi:uncharacterized membrane protein SirB2